MANGPELAPPPLDRVTLWMRVALTWVVVLVVTFWRQTGRDEAADRGAIVGVVLIYFWFRSPAAPPPPAPPPAPLPRADRADD